MELYRTGTPSPSFLFLLLRFDDNGFKEVRFWDAWPWVGKHTGEHLDSFSKTHLICKDASGWTEDSFWLHPGEVAGNGGEVQLGPHLLVKRVHRWFLLLKVRIKVALVALLLKHP